MTNTMTSRVEHKTEIVERLRTKLTNLEEQIALCESGREKTLAELAAREAELEVMTALQVEYLRLEEESEPLREDVMRMIEEDRQAWTPERSEDDKLEFNPEYLRKSARLREVGKRMEEIPLEVNRIFFNRGKKD